MVTKADIDDFEEKINFDVKLKYSNKKVILTNNVAQISEKGYGFLLGRMYFTGVNGYQNFLVFTPMLC